MDSSTQTTDVILVGAGPIGIEMAVALKRANVDYIHLDAKQIGYTISWFAPQTKFFSSNERIAIAGVPLQTPDGAKSTREQYLAYLRSVVEQFDLRVNTYEPVVGIKRLDSGGFEIATRSTKGSTTYRCKRLILATGGTDRPRKLNVPGEDLPHVSFYFTDPHLYFHKKLLIIGGKNSAVEAALRCYNAGAHVAISYRRDALPNKSIKYWLMPEIQLLMDAGRIATHFSTTVGRVTLDSVTLRSCVDGSTCEVEADFVLALIGYEQDDTLFKLAGVEQQGDCSAPVVDERTMQSSIPGLYVIGTAIAGTQDKYRVFIENCHVHVDRVMSALTGNAVDPISTKPGPVGALET